MTGDFATIPAPAVAEECCQDGLAGQESAPIPRPDRWSAWDAFLDRTPETGFMQTSWWVDFRSTCGFENFGVTLKDGEEILGGAVVLKYRYDEGNSFYYIQDGPVLPSDPLVAEEIFRVILDEVEHHRQADQTVVSHLRIEPRWMELPAFARGFRAIRPLADRFLETRDTRWIDLRPDESAILAQMKSKGRYNIGVARRHGVSIVEDNSARGVDDFLRLYKRMAVRKGLTPKPPDYFRTLISALSSRRQGSLFFAEYQGRRISTALVVYFGPRATYFFGASLAIHRNVMAPYLMHFEIMRKAKALGHEWYDLWGIAPRNEPNHPWQDISSFKARFGGLEVNLVPTLDLVYDVRAYEHYVAAEGKPDWRLEEKTGQERASVTKDRGAEGDTTSETPAEAAGP
jgi:lipid II:glycine glycyltransferase (peptidoglycan interpeptide bridge formation enzyme)